MTALLMTLGIGFVVMMIVGVGLFLTIKSNQYDDLEGASHRILLDDDDANIPDD